MNTYRIKLDVTATMTIMKKDDIGSIDTDRELASIELTCTGPDPKTALRAVTKHMNRYLLNRLHHTPLTAEKRYDQV